MTKNKIKLHATGVGVGVGFDVEVELVVGLVVASVFHNKIELSSLALAKYPFCNKANELT